MAGFPKHKYHGIPVYRNVDAVKDGKVHHYVGPVATVEQGIAVDLLTPEHLWATFQREAEDVLKVDGKWIADDKLRNRRINAAYARLWLADRRFQWAGLAAFASKQVGCGLLHAADIVGANRRQRELASGGTTISRSRRCCRSAWDRPSKKSPHSRPTLSWSAEIGQLTIPAIIASVRPGSRSLRSSFVSTTQSMVSRCHQRNSQL